VVLAVLTASFDITDYSFPWNQICYWAVKIMIGVPDAILKLIAQRYRKTVSTSQTTKTSANM
jgi:cytochrome b6